MKPNGPSSTTIRQNGRKRHLQLSGENMSKFQVVNHKIFGPLEQQILQNLTEENRFFLSSLSGFYTHDSPSTGATHSIMISIACFALQSEDDIIAWFPGGQLRLIDWPVYFLFRWRKKFQEMKRPEDLSVFLKRERHQRCSSHEIIQFSAEPQQIDSKWLSHTGRALLRFFIWIVPNTSSVCICCFTDLKYACVRVWPDESTHPHRIIETLDYILCVLKKLL